MASAENPKQQPPGLYRPSPSPNPNSAAPPPPPPSSSSSYPPPSAASSSPFSYQSQPQQLHHHYPPPPDHQFAGAPVSYPAPPLPANHGAGRMLSTKLPRGRRLTGAQAMYDVDVRNQGEVQPQLEVTPITKYISEPSLVLGRRIAANKSYLCYGLKLGAIRVLNIDTALRALLKGHGERVTDMAFFAEDVQLLASASIDGRVFVWKINEGPDEEDKPQILGKVVVAIQMMGEEESIHPRICWHSHKQEFLVLAIGKCVLKIDTTKVGRGELYSAEEPLKCSTESLIDGVQLVGKHDGEVTDLSMCQWMTTLLVSASSDGMVKIWEDGKAVPLAILRPHDGQPVSSAKFLTAPHSPEHIILLTAGPLNRKVKIWASASEGGLLPSDADSWKCTQTLELKSSESRPEEAFFNQVVALPHVGLILLANAKKNAIYAVHLEYGPCPAATRMDYIAEFTVEMPILSLAGTSDSLPDGNHTIEVYCVQTQAIQQYALYLSQCLPPPLENLGLEKSDSTCNRAPLAQYPIVSGQSGASGMHGLSTADGRGESGLTNFPEISSYDDNSKKGGNKILQNDISMVKDEGGSQVLVEEVIHEMIDKLPENFTWGKDFMMNLVDPLLSLIKFQDRMIKRLQCSKENESVPDRVKAEIDILTDYWKDV